MNRAVAPLRPADDAKIIDSSNMSIDEVFTEVLTSLQDKGLIGEF
jgi:cytidylate kinase